MDMCIFCKGPTDRHCETSACAWHRCPTCDAVIDRAAAKALHRGLAVPWPYAVPDAGEAS